MRGEGEGCGCGCGCGVRVKGEGTVRLELAQVGRLVHSGVAVQVELLRLRRRLRRRLRVG